MRRWFAVAGLSCAALSCSDAAEEPTAPDGGRCAADEIALEDGTCVAPGVPPEACGLGFEPDGEHSCVAVLPAEPCPPGTVAFLGETTCAPLAPCGEGPWGDLPVDEATQFVDPGYAGADSDGSAARPWTSVATAIAAAAPTAIVALAAGSYAESVQVTSKPVRIWGRCPELVELVGPSTAQAVVMFAGQASGSELRNVAVRASRGGVGVLGVRDVILEHVWIREAGDHGVHMESLGHDTSLRIARSVIEGCVNYGLLLAEGESTVEDVVVRGTLATTDPGAAGVRLSGLPDRPALATVRGLIAEGNQHISVLVRGASATISDSLVRDGAMLDDGTRGLGIVALDQPPVPATVRIERSVVERVRGSAVHVEGSSADLMHLALRDVQPNQTPGVYGYGLVVMRNRETGARSTGTIRESAVVRTSDVGMLVYDSDGTVERTVLRAVLPRPLDGLFGDGIDAVGETGQGASLAVSTTEVSDAARVGIGGFGADVSMEHTRLACNAIHLSGADGAMPYSFERLGPSWCGCHDEQVECVVAEAQVEPPAPPDRPGG